MVMDHCLSNSRVQRVPVTDTERKMATNLERAGHELVVPTFQN